MIGKPRFVLPRGPSRFTLFMPLSISPHNLLYKRIIVWEGGGVISDEFREYLRELGRRGGRSRSDRKLAAARRNMAFARRERLRQLRDKRAAKSDCWFDAPTPDAPQS